MNKKSFDELEEVLIEAYCQAAQARADMRATTKALENLRDQARSGALIMEVLADLDDEIGLANLRDLGPILVEVRDRYFDLASAEDIQRLERRMEKHPNRAWSLWLNAYVKTFHERGWQFKLGQYYAEYGLTESPAPDWPLERIRQATRDVLFGMWAETYDWFVFLSNQTTLSSEQQARLLVILAEIQLFHFDQPTKVHKLLEEASQLAPEDARVIGGWGEYWLQIDELEKARQCFIDFISMKPDLVDGYVMLGEYYERSGQHEDARRQYELAINTAPGQLNGYKSLFNWYGRPKVFKDRGKHLEQLFERMSNLADFKPIVWIYKGIVYRKNRKYAEARSFFEKSQSINSDYPSAGAWLGHTYLDEAMQVEQEEQSPQTFYDQAQMYFNKVIEKAPRALVGYWGLASLYIRRKDLDAGLKSINDCFPIHTEWESFLCRERSDVLRRMGKLAEAEQDLLRSLEIEPQNPTALKILSNLVNDYQNKVDILAAKRTLDILREYKDDSYEYTYQNHLGNLYYGQGEYDKAANYYRKAVDAKPTDAVLHSNLALALENLRVPGRREQELEEAIRHLKEAIKLNSTVETYPKRLEELTIELREVHIYGEKASDYVPVVKPIRILFDNDLEADILDDSLSELSKETQEMIKTLREDIKQRFGIPIPGVFFRSYPKIGGEYKILIKNVEKDTGSPPPGMYFAHNLDAPDDYDSGFIIYYRVGEWISLEEAKKGRPGYENWSVTEYILRNLKHVLESDLAEMVGFQETYNFLDTQQDQVSQSLKENVHAVLILMQVFKYLLSNQNSIAEFGTYCQVFAEQIEAGLSPETIAQHFINTQTTSSIDKPDETELDRQIN